VEVEEALARGAAPPVFDRFVMLSFVVGSELAECCGLVGERAEGAEVVVRESAQRGRIGLVAWDRMLVCRSSLVRVGCQRR
jgi:hypothetical protein